MKKINFILICVIIALVFVIIGFFIGINVKDKCILNFFDSKEKELIGTYKTNTWNGKEAVLVLNGDKTMIYPSGNRGIWFLEEDKLFVEYDSEISLWDDSGMPNTQTTKNKKEVTIVDNGLMINTHFFQKVK